MKKTLRKKFISERNSLASGYRNSSTNTIFATLEEQNFFESSEKIFIYVGFGSEITTETFIKKWINKKQIFVPKIENGKMNLIRLKSWDELAPGHFGVLEPTSSDYYEGKIDLVVTPSIVFDNNGYRLGYGKGYYDKYFSSREYDISVGLSYHKLLQDNVPKEDHDIKVDVIITEEKTFLINEKYNSNNKCKNNT